MARLIDYQAAVDRYYAEFEKQDICDGAQDRDWLKRCFDESPTIDPVHAANGCYCWECKYYREFRTNRNKQLMRLCYRMGKHDMEYCVKPDDFCSYGQLREGSQ